jgi:hypothetical protein
MFTYHLTSSPGKAMDIPSWCQIIVHDPLDHAHMKFLATYLKRASLSLLDA